MACGDQYSESAQDFQHHEAQVLSYIEIVCAFVVCYGRNQ